MTNLIDELAMSLQNIVVLERSVILIIIMYIVFPKRCFYHLFRTWWEKKNFLYKNRVVIVPVYD